MKISNLPNNMPSIWTISVPAEASALVKPLETPTVPKADPNSYIASIKEASAVKVKSKVPIKKIPM